MFHEEAMTLFEKKLHPYLKASGKKRGFIYLLAIAFFTASYISTRGSDGKLLFFLIIYPVIGFIYIFLLNLLYKNKITFHTAGHLVAFEIANIAGFYGSSLTGMAGSLYLYICVSAVVIVSAGIIIKFITGELKNIM